MTNPKLEVLTAQNSQLSVGPVLSQLRASVERRLDVSLPVNDPNEKINRHVMAANQEVLRPAAEVVKAAIPAPVHDRLHDFEFEFEGTAHLRE